MQSISAYSFIDLVQYLFTVPGVKSFLTEKISQDPLEKYFGQHRQRGRTNENPSSAQFLKNQQALRVVNSIRIRGLIKGNTRGNKEPTQILTESEPLPKRQRTSTLSSTIRTTPASSSSSPAMHHDVLPRQDSSSPSNPRLITELESKY